jgi:hypothetical protein
MNAFQHHQSGGTHTRHTGPLALIVGLALLIANVPGAMAQETSSVEVGPSEVTYTSDWELIGSNNEDPFHIAFFVSRTVAGAMFDYTVLDDGHNPITDNATLIETESLSIYESLEMFSDFRLLGSGTLPDGTLWQLYALRFDGQRYSMLITANAEGQAGVDVLSTLLTPEISLIRAHFAVTEGFTVDGQPVPIAQVDQGDILSIEMEFLVEDYEASRRKPGPPSNPAP